MSKSCIKNIKIGDHITLDPFYIAGENVQSKDIQFTIVGKWKNCHLLGTRRPGFLPHSRFHYLPETYDTLANDFDYFYLADLYVSNNIRIYKNV